MKAPTQLHLLILVEAVEHMANLLAQSDVVLSELDERQINVALEAARETRETQKNEY
jgi:F0F1-type ATP synthase epsilon subunit